MPPSKRRCNCLLPCAIAARSEAQKHVLDAYPSLQKMYQPGDGNTEVYYLKNAAAQICSFAEAPRTIKF